MANSAWWKLNLDDDDQVHVKLTPLCQWAEEASSMLYWKDQVHEGIYNNRMYSSSDYQTSLELLSRSGFTAAKLNVTRSIVQTIVSKLGVKRPAIKFSADDVDWSYKQRARQLTRIIRGSNETMQVARVYPEVIKATCVNGTGIAYVDVDDGKVVIERVPREELFVDPREARYGKPRSLYRHRIVAREVLIARFPEHEDEITNAKEAEGWVQDESSSYDGEQTNMIDVWQAWHLPSSQDADDGRYAMVIGNTTLCYEKWEVERFPFAFMFYDKPLKGFWARGVVEDLADIQWKIDETVRDIQSALYFGAQLKIWIRQGSPIPKTALGRTFGPSVYTHDGVKPEFESPNPVSDDQVAFLDRLISLAHDLTGVSMMQAQAKNPIGAGASAVALQEFYDIQSERYSQLEAMCSNWWLDVDTLVIDAYKRLAKEDEDYAVKWAHRDVVHQVKWSEVKYEGDNYRMILEPTNFLPDTRAGKLEGIERLAKAGIATGPELSAVMGGFPDLERANRLRNSAYEIAEWVMELLADPDEDFDQCAPDPHMDLDLTLNMAKAELNRARVEKAPEEVLERYRLFLDLLTSMINEAKTAMPPPMPAGDLGAMPPGMPPPGAAPMMPPAGGAPMPPVLPPMGGM